MRPLDEGFVARVRETSTCLAAVGFLALAAHGAAHAVLLSFAAGFFVAQLIWYSAQRIGRRLGVDDLTRRQKVGFGALYLAKYAIAAVVIWTLGRVNLLDGLGFTGGFSIPLLTVMLKAFGWQTLGQEVDPVPFYSRPRRPRKVG